MILKSSLTISSDVPLEVAARFISSEITSFELREEARRSLKAGTGYTLYVGQRPNGERVETLVPHDTGRAGQAVGDAAVWGSWCEHGDEGHILLDETDGDGNALYADLDGNEVSEHQLLSV